MGAGRAVVEGAGNAWHCPAWKGRLLNRGVMAKRIILHCIGPRIGSDGATYRRCSSTGRGKGTGDDGRPDDGGHEGELRRGARTGL